MKNPRISDKAMVSKDSSSVHETSHEDYQEAGQGQVITPTWMRTREYEQNTAKNSNSAPEVVNWAASLKTPSKTSSWINKQTLKMNAISIDSSRDSDLQILEK